MSARRGNPMVAARKLARALAIAGRCAEMVVRPPAWVASLLARQGQAAAA